MTTSCPKKTNPAGAVEETLVSEMVIVPTPGDVTSVSIGSSGWAPSPSLSVDTVPPPPPPPPETCSQLAIGVNVHAPVPASQASLVQGSASSHTTGGNEQAPLPI